jgi:predicted exporter
VTQFIGDPATGATYLSMPCLCCTAVLGPAPTEAEMWRWLHQAAACQQVGIISWLLPVALLASIHACPHGNPTVAVHALQSIVLSKP